MITMLRGNQLFAGSRPVAGVQQNAKGWKWSAIFGGGRTGRTHFPTAIAAVKACAKACGLTVRQAASWEDIKVEFEDDCPNSIRFMVERFAGFIGSESIYGEDAILAAMYDHLSRSTYVLEHGLYIHRGGHHVAICAADGSPIRFALITAEDKAV